MGVIRTIKRAVIKRLKLIYKHYRYKIYFPKLYRQCCKDNPVQENKILFLEMRGKPCQIIYFLVISLIDRCLHVAEDLPAGESYFTQYPHPGISP